MISEVATRMRVTIGIEVRWAMNEIWRENSATMAVFFTALLVFKTQACHNLRMEGGVPPFFNSSRDKG